MLLAIIGALIGAAFGGIPGLLIGGFVGYVATIWLKHWFIGNLQVAQSALLDSTFEVMGALSKADGVVTRDEINAVEQIFRMLNLTDELRDSAKEAFRRGKQPDFDVDAAVARFAAISRGQRPIVSLFLQLQVMAVVADGRIDPAEHAMLVRIAKGLRLDEHDVAQLEALLRASAAGPAGGRAAPTADRLADAYTALGVTPDAGDAEIKRAYRRLISQNHPDKLAARGLPESMRGVAEERSREINAAYDLIKEARNIK